MTHTAATRTLPGLLVLGDGALFVMEDARLRVSDGTPAVAWVAAWEELP